jgi:hypothetical protein
MQHAMLEGLGTAANSTQLLRVDVDFRLPKAQCCTLSRVVGRTAHIEFLVSEAYVRFLVWGVIAKYGLIEPAKGAWV